LVYTRYGLVAVVEHLGDAYGGHYVCYGRRHGARGPDWLLFNDAQVRPATLHEVAPCIDSKMLARSLPHFLLLV
jgi:ubiquitin C-terminal hydrolase